MRPIAQWLLLGLVYSWTWKAEAYPQQDQRPIGDVQTDSTSQISNLFPEKLSTPPSYRHALLDLHKALVSIPSISGNEVKVAHFLAGYLSTRGYNAHLQEIPRTSHNNDALPKRFNVIASPPTNDSSSAPSHPPRLLVTSHIDVVPPYIPYHIDASTPADITADTLITGRGSVDAKASVASQITAVESLLSTNSISPRDVTLLFVVGEETTGDGMKTFSAFGPDDKLKFEAAIFGEPTENRLACGHKGITFGRIRARGKAGHSGYPWLGKSATEVLIRALGSILQTDLGSSERFGNTTVNIGRIEGGVAANVIPKYAEASLSVRIAAGDKETGADIIREKLWGVLRETDEEALSMESIGGYGPVECDCDVDGFDTMVANYGTDVPHLAGDHVSYLYGPGSILVAHGDDEGLRVGDLEESVEGYKKLIKHVLKA